METEWGIPRDIAVFSIVGLYFNISSCFGLRAEQETTDVAVPPCRPNLAKRSLDRDLFPECYC